MKTIYKVLIGTTGLLMATSCMDQMDKDPIGLLTPDIVNTSPTLNSVQYSVTSSYQMLSNTLNLLGDWAWDAGTVTRNDFVLYDIGSDDADKKWNPDGDQPWMDEVHNYSFIASNAAFSGIWSYLYEGIARANLALSYLNDDETIATIEMDAATRKRLLGETYFLRAFYYFDLVTNFGGVPLMVNPINDFDEAYQVAAREDKEVVWKQINDDLAAALANIPEGKYASNEERWRVSQGAVLAMQAKVALYNKDFDKVKEVIATLEGKNYYQLNANYFDSFSVHREFQDDEVIFAYDHQEFMTPANGNGLCALLGWGFFAPSASLIAAFEPNDPRKDYTFNVEDRLIYKVLGDTNGDNQGNEDSPSNRIYIRYADVLLWKAEALIETGDIPGGIRVINAVRERARNTIQIDGTTAPAGTLTDRSTTATKDQALEWLRHERRVELALESHRLRDLKRWGIAKQVLNANGQGFEDRNYLFPIPQRDINKSGGLLTQNTGY
ncbi:MAG: RagB/SusD family nutrient uptake outer membrane protein [Tannerellaceae bacterium]|nr:RagB/SusD family nutrient uptake outer membrane protein [Tannerellaceae bacterium]